MSQIKKFFSKIKTEAKFSRAGEGHRLNEPTSPRGTSTTASAAAQPITNRQNCEPISGARAAAAEAAQQRFQHQVSRQQSSSAATRTADSVRRQAQREIEEEKALENQLNQALELKQHYFGNKQVSVDSSPVVDVSKLLFKCTDIFGDDIALPYEEIQKQIEDTLRLQMDSEPLVASTLLFINCNQAEQEKLDAGRQIIMKYFDNIISNPGEEKFRRIRLQNKVYLEKVAPLKYAIEFLQASGFVMSEDRESIVYQENSVEALTLARDTLEGSQPIQVELDRNVNIFQAGSGRNSVPAVQLLPQDPRFYQMTGNEVLRQKQRQKEIVEKEEMLRTKAMRERDEKSDLNIQYKYTVIRVRFPNGTIIQAIFPARDCLSSLFEFLRTKCLSYDWLPFILTSTADRRIYSSQDENGLTFLQADLVPAAIVSFQWNERAVREVQGQKPDFSVENFIKNELYEEANRL